MKGDFLPVLPCDRSEREAIRFAAQGKSFVLHGPPGTGKSSTIAAMIADALYKGKKVLFVAEKRAAVEVVKARLDLIGIGEFCLDLHSKSKPNPIARSLLKTLALPRGELLLDEENFLCAQKRAKVCRNALLSAHTALYAEQDGFSAFRATEEILRHRNAPHAVEVGFYGEDVSSLLLTAVSSARACGEIKVGRTEFSEFFREQTLHGAREVMLEVRHFKAAFALFASALGQCSRPFPLSALDDLVKFIGKLSDRRFCRKLLQGKGELRLIERIFSPFDRTKFFEGLSRIRNGEGTPVLDGMRRAAEGLFSAQQNWENILQTEQDGTADELFERAGKFLERVDLLPRACIFRQAELALQKRGVRFLLPPEELGDEDALASYQRERARAYLERRIKSDLPILTGDCEREAENSYLHAEEELHHSARKYLKSLLLSRLPREDECGAIQAVFTGAEGERDLAALISNAPAFDVLAPCLLMDPAAVSRFLPKDKMFDLVLFDEASQLTTEEAASSVSRGKAVVAVGDPKQLPPTSFFHAGERKTSVLDDLLLMGLPEKRLCWHYRSKHESLISFSNAMYYENRLRTVPPCDRKNRVRLIAVEGVYDRGGTKINFIEAEKLTDEIVRRLQDEELWKKSMGVVTFSEAQQKLIEKLLFEKLSSEELRARAYQKKEPLFCKNLENVQGDERDVVFISVCYGPSADGKLSSHFGPLNRVGGSRRLNVALSRAREETLVFSSFPVHRFRGKASGGAAELLSFLEYAARETYTIPREVPREGDTELAKAIKEELEKCGYRCRTAVGASDFVVDVAVLDEGKDGYLLGILSDGGRKFSFEDEARAETLLTRAGWKIERVGAVEWAFNREEVLSRLKGKLDELSGRSRAEEWLKAYCKPYRKARFRRADGLLPSDVRDEEIEDRLRRIVAVEGPISRAFLKRRCLELLQTGGGEEIEKRIDRLIDTCRFPFDRAAGVDYFYNGKSPLLPAKLRLDRGKLRRGAEDVSAYEIVSAVRGALQETVSLSEDEAVELLKRVLRIESEPFSLFIKGCIAYGEERGVLQRSSSGRLLARENP